MSSEILHGDKAISIHAPRTGSDFLTSFSVKPALDFNPRSPHGERQSASAFQSVQRYFNPRSPHGERRVFALAISFDCINFNPRSPHGERRLKALKGANTNTYFNPRSPHGERQISEGNECPAHEISIHAPRTGSDHFVCRPFCRHVVFQSTLPARGATIPDITTVLAKVISIHAPRTGSD